VLDSSADSFEARLLQLVKYCESGNLLDGNAPLVVGSTHCVQFSCLIPAMTRLHGDAHFMGRSLGEHKHLFLLSQVYENGYTLSSFLEARED
jgi:hypothetical protein